MGFCIEDEIDGIDIELRKESLWIHEDGNTVEITYRALGEVYLYLKNNQRFKHLMEVCNEQI